MIYKFYCPKCKTNQEIKMKITEYTEQGHKCGICGNALERDISDVCSYFDTRKITGFCGKCN